MTLITNIKKTGDYSWTIETGSIIIAKLIRHIIKNAYIESNKVHITAESIMSLKDHLSIKPTNKLGYIETIRLMKQISTQLTLIYNTGNACFGIDLSDILVINNRDFLFCGSKHMLPLDQTKTFITFVSPFDNPDFSNPDILEIKKLPSRVHFKCIYYSIAALGLWCFTGDYLLVGNEIPDENQVEQILNPIKATKLYGFFKRALTTQAKERLLLLV